MQLERTRQQSWLSARTSTHPRQPPTPDCAVVLEPMGMWELISGNRREEKHLHDIIQHEIEGHTTIMESDMLKCGKESRRSGCHGCW